MTRFTFLPENMMLKKTEAFLYYPKRRRQTHKKNTKYTHIVVKSIDSSLPSESNINEKLTLFYYS